MRIIHVVFWKMYVYTYIYVEHIILNVIQYICMIWYVYIYTYRQIDIERYIQIYYVIKTRPLVCISTSVSLVLILYIKYIYTWNLLRNPVEPDLSLHQSLPDILRNLVEPDPAPRAHKNAKIRFVARTTTTTTTTTTTKKKKKEKKTTTKKKEESQKCNKKMCCKLQYEKHIKLCSAPARMRREHEQHQRSHYYT